MLFARLELLRPPMSDIRPIRSRGGFQLVELMVVIAIVALTLALLIPAIQGARHSSQRVNCINNLKQLALGIWGYEDRHGSLPPGYVSAVVMEHGVARELGPGWGWTSQMLPQIEQYPTYKSIRYDLDIREPVNRPARIATLNSMTCPSSPGAGPLVLIDAKGKRIVTDLAVSSFVGVGGLGGDRPEELGVFVRNEGTPFEAITDGMSQTLLLGERSRDLGPATWVGAPAGWVSCRSPDGKPLDCRGSRSLVLGYAGPLAGGASGVATPNHPRAGADGFASGHLGGANFAFGDGSVRFVVDEIDPAVFAALATRAGGEAILNEGRGGVN